MPVHIKVAQLGKPVADLTLEDGDTVEVALTSAGVSPTNGQIRVNNEPTGLDRRVREGDRVTVTPPIRGGQV